MKLVRMENVSRTALPKQGGVEQGNLHHADIVYTRKFLLFPVESRRRAFLFPDGEWRWADGGEKCGDHIQNLAMAFCAKEISSRNPTTPVPTDLDGHVTVLKGYDK